MSLGVALSCLFALGLLAWALLPIVLEGTVVSSSPTFESSELEDLYIQREGTYSTLKELEFDYEAGKLMDEDYRELRARYSAEAVRLLQRIDELEAEADARSKATAKTSLSASPGAAPTQGPIA